MNAPVETPEVQPVPDWLAIDVKVLTRFLAPRVPALAEGFSVTKFRGGQSNPTYRLDADSGSFVLRRKPPGQTFASAHAVDREARVMRALATTPVPVPKILAEHEDASLIGSPFYVMEYLDGRIFWDAQLASQTPADRREIYFALADALAALHMVNPEAVGLADFGPRGNYYSRQIDRWAQQYRAVEDDPVPLMELLLAWLETYVPDDDTTCLVHGDYRLDNAVFHKEQPKMLGLIDWELATLGNPMADLSYFLLNWMVPLNLSGGVSLANSDLAALGIPTAEEVTERYFSQVTHQRPADFRFHHAYNLFRLAAILHGIAARHRAGNASSDKANRVRALVEPAVSMACNIVGIW